MLVPVSPFEWCNERRAMHLVEALRNQHWGYACDEHEHRIDSCTDDECSVCSLLICPHFEPLHFHHDGCPACSMLHDWTPECDDYFCANTVRAERAEIKAKRDAAIHASSLSKAQKDILIELGDVIEDAYLDYIRRLETALGRKQTEVVTVKETVASTKPARRNGGVESYGFVGR